MADAQPLILVPGLVCTPALWAGQLRGLAGVASMSVADHTRHETMAEIAASILAAAPPRFALAGLSMGGFIALEIVRQAPERVTKLALLDTNARADAPERKEQRLKTIALARAEGMGKVSDGLMPVFIHKDRLADADLVAAVRQMALDTGVETFARQSTAIMGRKDSRPLLAAIRCPTLVLVGRQDALTPLELSQEIAAGIAGAKLEVIEACGHLSTMERPEAVNAAMTAWLAA